MGIISVTTAPAKEPYMAQPDKELKTVVIELHYEAERKTHPFSANDTWGKVHEWACEKFGIADDACPNLELRADSAVGGVLNDDAPIGDSAKHRTVWLVKPGPEPFGVS